MAITTALVATKALRRLRIVAPDESPSAADQETAEGALTEMVAAFKAEGLSGDPTTVAGFDDRFEQGLIAMLALRLTEEYGKEPTQLLVRDADRGWAQMQAAFFAVPASQFDYGVKETGHDSPSSSTLIGNDPQPYGVWQSSTAYVTRQVVMWNGNIYECTMAGTSGTTGPSGTGTEVTDGTVTWCFRSATGIITVDS